MAETPQKTAPEIRGLSVRQPWAWAIRNLKKTPENRTRRTNYRGLVAIHAPLTVEHAATMPTPATIRAYLNARWNHVPELYAKGVIIAVAELTGCHLDAECWHTDAGGHVSFCTPWAQRDSWHWKLANVKPTLPISCTGARGLFPLPDFVADVVRTYVSKEPRRA